MRLILNESVSTLGEIGDEVNVKAGSAYADSVQLIQMLFDGLIDSLSVAEGQIEREEIQAKGESLSRAIKIIVGLQGSLSMEKGGEIATNLASLYDYCTRRLMHANLKNDLEAVQEVKRLISEIRDAWSQVPELLQQQQVANIG